MPVRSKLIRERAKANAKRIGTHAIVNTLANSKSRKLVNAIAQTAPAQADPASNGEKPYLVMVDHQGRAYLRVEINSKGAKFLLNTGHSIELAELDNGTIRSRNLKAVPQASVLEAAKILARPLISSVTIAERSKPYLNSILNDEELNNMAKAAKSKKAAGKTAKGKATGAKRGPRVNLEAIVKLNKYPEEGVVKGYALSILDTLKDNGKKLTVAELVKKMKSGTTNKGGEMAVYTFHRAKLEKGGFITVDAA